MKIFDPNGKLVTVDVRPSSYPMRETSKSQIQTLVGKVLRDIYPRESILEEFTVPSTRLSVDFFIPRLKIVIEVNGKQHDEFVPHFHGNKETSNKFVKQVSRDRTKAVWAEVNNFKLIEIPYGSTEPTIRSLIS